MMDVPVVHTSTTVQEGREFTDAVSFVDDGKPIDFIWKFPRGTLDPRMSALELAEFVLFHMPRIIPLLFRWPRAQLDFTALYARYLTTPKEALDEVVAWCLPVTRTGPDDIITMNLNALAVPPKTILTTY